VGCIDSLELISRGVNAMFQFTLALFQFVLGGLSRPCSNLCSDGNSVTCDSEEKQNLFQFRMFFRLPPDESMMLGVLMFEKSGLR